MIRLPFFGTHRRRELPLLEEFHRTLALLEAVHRQFDYSDPEFIDSTIFAIGAAECRLAAILRRARKEGISAW